MEWVRQAAVAGTFYPGDPKELEAQIADFCDARPDEPRRDARFVLAPHAGYAFSGRTAGQIYRRVKVPSTVLVLCPNHTGLGARLSVWDRGAWSTPLGQVPVDSAAAARFMTLTGLARSDRAAHRREHAIEVHLPFLRALNPEVAIVPVVVGPFPFAECERIGHALAAWLDELPDTMVIASSDMSHYVPVEEARVKDELALNQWKSVDPKRFYETVTSRRISMCGFIPATCTLAAARALGKTRGDVLAYTHSGRVTGDEDSVVGYAAGWIL